MVGVGTVLADDPMLTDRREDRVGDVADRRQPARLVIDTTLRIPLDCSLVRSARSVRTVVACADDADRGQAEELAGAGVGIWRVRRGGRGVDIGEVLTRAAEEGLLSILAEGGASVAGSLLESGLVDRVAFFIAPKLYGSGGRPALPELGTEWWGRDSTFEHCSWREIGSDCLFEADVAHGEEVA
jgi:diaminohydroxyphosphoribosylaminopyrimidine deaminase/5-amino-6-(5-phosphoribosylamino)uracil reductase